MANAGHDANMRPTIICASQIDGMSIVQIQADSTNHRLKTDNNTTGGDNGNNHGNAVDDENGVAVWTALSSANDGAIIEVYGLSNSVLINST